MALVSICIPTYNGATFLEEALNSVKEQTYRNIEVIVSDDDSSDETLSIIEKFKVEVDFPVFIFNHQPNGIGSNWNNTVRNAKGEYIKFLFQDDVLLPTCIERMVSIAENNENVGLVYCKREIIYNPENKYDVRWMKRFGSLHDHWQNLQIKEGILEGKTYLSDPKLLEQPMNKIGEPTAVLLHKKCFEKIGFFSTQLKQTLDVEYWYRLMPFFNIGFVNEELVNFRLHHEQATQTNKNTNTKDKKLLPKLFLKNIFTYLHRKQKNKILKEKYYNTLYFQYYKKVKNKLKKTFNF